MTADRREGDLKCGGQGASVRVFWDEAILGLMLLEAWRPGKSIILEEARSHFPHFFTNENLSSPSIS